MKTVKNENLINALYTLADAYAELAQIAMIHGDKDEVYRLVIAERAALNKARKIEAGWKL